jgi:hypothetical protein
VRLHCLPLSLSAVALWHQLLLSCRAGLPVLLL